MDVNSLYTNIPHEETRLIVQRILDQRPDPHPPTQFLMELMDLVLEKNILLKIKKFFLQIRGVAMGVHVPQA